MVMMTAPDRARGRAEGWCAARRATALRCGRRDKARCPRAVAALVRATPTKRMPDGRQPDPGLLPAATTAGAWGGGGCRRPSPCLSLFFGGAGAQSWAPAPLPTYSVEGRAPGRAPGDAVWVFFPPGAPPTGQEPAPAGRRGEGQGPPRGGPAGQAAVRDCGTGCRGGSSGALQGGGRWWWGGGRRPGAEQKRGAPVGQLLLQPRLTARHVPHAAAAVGACAWASTRVCGVCACRAAARARPNSMARHLPFTPAPPPLRPLPKWIPYS